MWISPFNNERKHKSAKQRTKSHRCKCYVQWVTLFETPFMRGRFRSNGWLQPCDRDGVLEKGFRSWGFQRLSANACGNCTEKYFSTKVCFRNQQKCKTGALRPRMPYRMSFLEEFVCSEPKISKWRRRGSKREQTGTKRKPKAPKREPKERKRKPKWSQKEPKGCQKT